jgi:hypothetical protein
LPRGLTSSGNRMTSPIASSPCPDRVPPRGQRFGAFLQLKNLQG